MAAYIASSCIRPAAESGPLQENGAAPSSSHQVSELITTAKTLLEQNHELAYACLVQAITLLRQHNKQSSEESKKAGGLVSWQVKRLNVYIEQNLSAEIKTSQLAEVLGLSVSHFTRSFKQTVGISPQAYILRRRIDAACRMMLETNEPLIRIAHIHGFYDQSHFTRKFQLATGSAPQAWRKHHLMTGQQSDYLAAQ